MNFSDGKTSTINNVIKESYEKVDFGVNFLTLALEASCMSRIVIQKVQRRSPSYRSDFIFTN